MSDPLSILAGIVGIAATTAHAARRLKEFLDGIKEAPETIRSIAKEIGVLQYSLTTLRALLPSPDDFAKTARPGESVKCITSLKMTLTHCEQNLKSISRTVTPFVEKRNGPNESRWRKMAGWSSQKDILDSLGRELVNAKITLDVGISLAACVLISTGNSQTHAGISQLQTQFTQLSIRLERLLNEPVTPTNPSNPSTRADDKRPAKDLIDSSFGWRSPRNVDDNDFAGARKDRIIHNRGHSFGSAKTFTNDCSPPNSPLTRRTTFNSISTGSPISPVTSFTTSLSRSPKRGSRELDLEGPITNPSQPRPSTSTRNSRLAEHPLLERTPTGLFRDDAGWGKFQIPMKVFSEYFDLSFKKMMQKSPTSMLNFGIVTATPTSNSPAYIDVHADNDGDETRHFWTQINDSRLHRRSVPEWTLKIPGHKAAGGPPTKGVSRVSLSKVVRNGLSYEFIRLFVVAQNPPNPTAYNFGWKPFCVFTYIDHPRRIRDIGAEESINNVTMTVPNVTPVSVWLAVKGELLTFRLKSADDEHFLSPNYAYWSINPEMITD